MNVIRILAVAATVFASHARGGAQEHTGPNVLWITVDDMECASVGVFGCEIEGATPHIDALAHSGMRFARAHVSVAICQPTRAVWMTGRASCRNGATGFLPIAPGVPTLVEAVHDAGWFTALLAKEAHVVPTRHAAFDVIVKGNDLRAGRDPELFATRLREVIAQAKTAGRPFFVMANAQDPHRPFAGSDQEQRRRANEIRKSGASHLPESEPFCTPEQTELPGYLPDLPAVRRELAEYQTSVHRADATVGALLAVLDEAGVTNDTIVTFLSDHGMPLPFSKTNCYWQSTHTPWIWRWPGVTKSDAVDTQHFVAGIDLAPTLCDALGIAPLEGADGRSFVPLLRGGTQQDRERVFTQIDRVAGGKEFPMRAVHDGRWSYLWNPWSDGTKVFKNESQSGRTFAAMKRAAKSDLAIAARVELFEKRVPEELYDRRADPDSLVNLAADAAAAERLDAMRAQLLTWMESQGDPHAAAFEAHLAALRK